MPVPVVPRVEFTLLPLCEYTTRFLKCYVCWAGG